MRIKIYGGPLSISYNQAKFMKKMGMDITFYTDKNVLDASYRPGWEDGDASGVSCDWIREVDVNLKNCIFRTKKERDFLKELGDADILHTFGESSIWASFTDVPYIYSSYGYDLDQMPFEKRSLRLRMLGHLVKRSISKSKCIIVSPYQRKFLKELKLNTRTAYVPCAIDTDKYKRHETTLRNSLKENGNYDFIFFSPTRHEWSHSRPCNKQNDKFVNAFSRFIKESKKRALLVLVEKGDDLEMTKTLIKERGVEDFIMWIKPQNKKDLIDLYSASDMVFDQVTKVGGFGQVFLEAMSCGIPTFISLKDYDDLYDEQPPCINVSTENEIVAKITELTGDQKAIEEIGKKSREWMIRHHDWRVSIKCFKDLYESILG